jgi:tetratricopeptide (TPR) repeat protein
VETKVNLVLLAVLGAAWGAITLAEPAAALDPTEPTTSELAALEDAFALDRTDPVLARRLADHYLSLHSPQLAVAALSASSPEVREDPAILHRLAQAYEETGRMDDALATAQLALARCARALGSSEASEVTPVPTHGCTERTYAALDMHATALTHMARWGVSDPQSDPRSRTAYALAVRSARILSASAE